jgi:adenosylcobinamide kinase/adenosylcobinamide-phosphate guanylyltransferase
MARRIEKHRAERDSHWQVIEEGVELDAVLRDLARPDRVIVVDCMTLWLSNLFLRQLDMKTELAKLMADFETIPGLIVFVSNELGQGLAPDTTLGRSFRDEHGLMNQILASACSRVTLVAAGLPLVLK